MAVATKDTDVVVDGARTLDRDHALHLLHQMLRIRRLEEMAGQKLAAAAGPWG